MLSNKTRNKIKEHFDKHIEDDTYQEKYEKDFTNEDEEVQEFVKFYLQNASQLVSEVGYVPLPDADYNQGLKDFESFVQTSRKKSQNP